MKLSPEHYNQLKAALLDGFGVSELDATLRTIGHDLSDLASEQTNRRTIFHDVIESAEKGGWVDALVAAMKVDNPTNKKVAALPDHFPDDNKLAVEDTPRSPAPKPKRRKPGPVLPTDWPEPAVPYTFITPTRIGSTTDGKEMVLVPGGEFLFGEDKINWYLPPFWIDKTPVTQADYKRFLDANPNHQVPFRNEDWAPTYNWDQVRRTYPPGKDYHPVVMVSWHDAVAYAEWAGKRLPTEHEWEKAARGTDGRIYPWGDQWQDNHANTWEAKIGETSPVGQFSQQGDSPYGCVDMSGNVWEWTSTPYDAQSYRLRGGSWYYDQVDARVANAYRYSPDSWYGNLGFRLCVSSL